MGEYAKSLVNKLKVSDEELRDDILQRNIAAMDAHERQQSLGIIGARQAFELRLNQLRRQKREAQP